MLFRLTTIQISKLTKYKVKL